MIRYMKWGVLFLFLWGSAFAGAEEAQLTLQTGKVVNKIDEKIYGHFLEHIYHSVNGGLWGDLVWNRTFEQNSAGRWSVEDNCIVQKSLDDNLRMPLGDAGWTNYEYSLEACKTGGSEGFLIPFRVKGDTEFYWANFGGWGNKRHAIERSLPNGQGKRVVGPELDGQIETGRWYQIKVRCEGPKIQVFLDGKQTMEINDPEGPQGGQVGVGTWNTQAKFRNLKVTALDGKTLLEGVPTELANQPAKILHWESFGPGKVAVDAKEPLNSQYSVKIESGAQETGVAQSKICVEKGKGYEGSLWARGDATGSVTVRLLDGKTVLAEKKLGAVKKEWGELPFTLSPSASTADATLQVAVNGKDAIWLDQVSLMPTEWKKEGGFRPDLVKAVAGLKPPIIRWPGGCFASPYRWKDGVGPQHKRGIYPRSIWDDQDVNSYGTDEFLAMCRKVGAEPLIVVNIGTKEWNGPDAKREDFLKEVLAWMEYCNGPADSEWGRQRAANGHPEPYNVKYWEIDNETWHMKAEDYAAEVNIFAEAMRKAYPDIRLLACGSNGYGDGGNGLAWNATLIERSADKFDYLSIHNYEDPQRFDDGARAYEAFFRKTGDLIAKSKNPNLKIYVSEWNAQTTDWRTGLYAGGILNAFERCGDFLEIGGPALFLRHVTATGWDNAFINFDQKGWFPAPNYVVMQLWRNAYAPKRLALDGETKGLNCAASQSEDGKTAYLKAVNPTDKPVTVALKVEGAAPAKAAMQVVAPGALKARNTLEKPDAVKAAEGKVTLEGGVARFEMPAYSAAVVTLSGK